MRSAIRSMPKRPSRSDRSDGWMSEADVIVEQVDHGALALDLLGNQVDAEAAEQIGQIGGMDVGGRIELRIEQQRSRHLDEADAAVGKLARLEAQIGDVIDREAVAALRQCGEVLGFGRT